MRATRWMTILFLAISTTALTQTDTNPDRFEPDEIRKRGAKSFLDSLCAKPGRPVTVIQVDNWPRISELSYLLEAAYDEGPCRSVMSGHSSFIDNGVSTRAREAKFLIMGIKACAYPPALNSSQVSEDQLQAALGWARLMVERGETGFCTY